MQHISYMARACVLAAAFLFVPVVALAGSDGSFSGTVVDPSGSSVSGATVVARNERTGEERVVVANAEGRYVLTGLRPSVYTIKVTFQGFAPVEYTGVQLAAAQEFPLDLTLQAAGVTEAVTVKGNATSMDLELGPHRRQRHRARGREPAGERAPDVAADAAGAGLAERRHGHLERRPLQRPRQPAERDQVRRRRGVGDHRRRAGQHRRPDRLAVQAAGQPRERAGVPRRVEQLPGRVRHRHRRPGQRHHQVRLEPGARARCSSTTATTSSTPRTTSTRPATPTAASSRNCPSRSSASTSSAARSARRS